MQDGIHATELLLLLLLSLSPLLVLALLLLGFVALHALVGLDPGVAVGDGEATGIKLAPVNSEIAAVDSVTISGDN